MRQTKQQPNPKPKRYVVRRVPMIDTPKYCIAEIQKEGYSEDLAWLYSPRLAREFAAWLNRRGKK